jgi:glycerol dehydrogenase
MQRCLAPTKYVRDELVLERLGELLPPSLRRVLIAGGKTALQVTGERLTAGLKEAGREIAGCVWYGGECSPVNIEKLAAAVRDAGAEMLIGVGGGKALDTAKSAAWVAGVPVVTVPTIAATCAAFTGISIVYNEQGVFQEISRQARMPEMVLVDLATIARAPAVFLIAGIGDTLAKWYELEATARNRGDSAVIRSALQLAAVAREILVLHGEAALEAARFQEVNVPLAEVVDAIIMVSGLVSGLGGDECRTAGAHAVYSGLTCLPETHGRCHGETVAFGILVQLMMENNFAEAEKLIGYYRKLGLPVTFADLGLEHVTSQQLHTVAAGALATEDIQNLPFTVDENMLVQALLAADELGRKSGGTSI